MLLAACALLILLLVASPASAGDEYRDNGNWGSLNYKDASMDHSVISTASASISFHAHWDGPDEDLGVVLAIEPLPEGFSYSVEEARSTPWGYLLEEEGIVEVEITAEEGVEPGQYYMEPQLLDPIYRNTLASLPLHVTVMPYHLSLEVVAGPGGLVYPGQRLEWDLAMSAAAPVDRLVEVVVGFTPQGWEPAFTKRTTLLRHGSAEAVTMAVNVPDRVMPGDYTITFHSSTPDPRATEDEAEVTVTVPVVRGVRAMTLDSMVRVAVGGEATVGVLVENTGNSPTTIIDLVPLGADALPEGWSLDTTALPMALPAYAQETFEVVISLPDEAPLSPAGDHKLPLRVLTGLAATDADASVVVRVPEVDTLEIEVPALSSDFATSPTTSSRPYEKTTTLLLRDRGNLPGVRTLTMGVDHSDSISRVHLSQQTVLTTSGSETSLDLRVFISPEAKPGDYTVVVKAMAGSSVVATREVTFRLSGANVSLGRTLHIEPLDSHAVYTSAGTSLSSITGTVVNDGDDRVETAEVAMYDTTRGSKLYLGSVLVDGLEAGEEKEFSFVYEGDQDSDSFLLAQVTVPGTPVTDPSRASVESRIQAVPLEPATPGLPVVMILGMAVGTLAGLMVVLGTEAGRFAVMAFILVPLYTRLKPAQVTDHFIRGQILGYVKANPGETYTAIRRALKLTNGTFVYHARILESQGHIRSVKDGANRRFYPAEMRIPAEVKDVQLNQVQRMIYTIVMEYPGISQTRIAKMVNLAPSTVNYHVNIMTKVGVIERKRSGRLSLCFATDEAE